MSDRTALIYRYIDLITENNRVLADSINNLISRTRQNEDLVYYLLRLVLLDEVRINSSVVESSSRDNNENNNENNNESNNENNNESNTENDNEYLNETFDYSSNNSSNSSSNDSPNNSLNYSGNNYDIEDSRIEVNFNITPQEQQPYSVDNRVNGIATQIRRDVTPPPLYSPIQGTSQRLLSPIQNNPIFNSRYAPPLNRRRRRTLFSNPGRSINYEVDTSMANTSQLLYRLVSDVLVDQDNFENLEPVVVRPTDEQILNATQIVRYGDIEHPQNSRCIITLVEFSEDSHVTMIRGCGHMFDSTELNRWFDSNVRCPLCRYDIRNNNEIL